MQAASGRPPRRNPRRHGAALNDGLGAARTLRRLPLGIDPDLVFKIRASGSRLADQVLAARGLIPLGETADYLYFVLARDDATALQEAIARYSQGPDQEGAKGPLYTLFDRVEAIEPYGPDDRRGPGLGDLSPGADAHVVDVSIWPSDDWAEANRRAQIVRDVLEVAHGRIVHQSVGSRRTVLRVEVTQDALSQLLAVSVVERVRTPPVPFADPSDWRDVSADALTLRTRPGMAVGVLDDLPAAGHPLLAGLIASVTEIGPAGYSWQPPGHHGTEVVSRVLLPDLARELRDGSAVTATGTVHVARILEPEPDMPSATRFAGGVAGLPLHETVERAITELNDKHGVRVFNLSFGMNEPFDAVHVGELTEVLDELARDRDLVIVVPTGNAPAFRGSETASGHHAQRDYPAYLRDPAQRLCEPGPAALALTIGAIAHSEAAAPRSGRPALELRAVAGVGHASPFSRCGPGIGPSASRINKPDLVAEGGNWVHDSDADHVILEDPGVGVITAALDTTGRLFRAACGTSFAAPVVARCAADVLTAYPQASANLIRALVASSAQQPAGARTATDPVQRCRTYGYGQPDLRAATESGARRVTMIFDGDMEVDTVAIHPVPIPEDFARGRSSTRRITVALAFDPPVRRQRREYLAASMQLDLYRSIDIEDLIDVVSRQAPGDGRPPINDRRRVGSLKPGLDSLRSATLQVRTWDAGQLDLNDGESYLLAVTHRAHTWARGTDYERQKYAVAVTIEDLARSDLDLYSIVTQRVAQTIRARIRF